LLSQIAGPGNYKLVDELDLTHLDIQFHAIQFQALPLTIRSVTFPYDRAYMSNEKRQFPTVREMKRRRLYTDLLIALVAGLILSGLLAAVLWLLARYRV
jgi:hypothetical protein